MKRRKEQSVCEWMGVNPDKPDPYSLVGLAVNSVENEIIHGLRHSAENNSSGWYIWCGEYSEDENFFSPVCVKHIESYLDEKVLEFLDLPMGYRFLIDRNNYEDVWFDEKIVDVST